MVFLRVALTHPELAVQAVVGRRPIPIPSLQTISVPTLVLVGELDVLTPVGHARELADAIPGAELVVIPGAGHHTPIEQPELVTAAIAAFLERLPA
jgi:3-oxoadipate enol-lactonase